MVRAMAANRSAAGTCRRGGGMPCRSISVASTGSRSPSDATTSVSDPPVTDLMMPVRSGPFRPPVHATTDRAGPTGQPTGRLTAHQDPSRAVSYTHLRAHETVLDL